MTFLHTPVLKKQVIEALLLDRSGPLTIIDATLGLGGHTRAILDAAGPTARIVAFEWDEKNRRLAADNLAG
jgi:16S rRNA (cytosine1402-N4)-methyltransferase